MTTGPKLFFLLMLIFTISLSGNGQQKNSKFQYFTTEDGLSSNVVYSIMQDSKGYLWIGTNEGLNRYDGYGFKIFRHLPGDTTSLTANAVFSVCEDSQGNIWAVTTGGICRFNYAKNTFTRIKFSATYPVSLIQQIIQVNKDELMIAPQISLLNIHTLQARKIAIGVNNIDQYIPHPLSKDKKGNIYLVAFDQDSISSTNTVLIYDAQQRSFNEFLKFQPKKHPRTGGLSYFFIDSHNSSWIGTGIPGRLFRYGPGSPVNMSLNASILNTNQEVINKIFEDNDGNIWINTAKGVYLFDHITGSISNFQLDPSGENATIVATAISQDRTGVIWIGSLNGLYKINPTKGKFRSLTKNSGSKTALLNNFVLGIRATSMNKIMIEYYWGIREFSLLDLPGQTIDHYLLKDYNFIDYLKKIILKNPENFNEESFRRSLPFFLGYKKNLEHQYASSLLFDSQKNLWLLDGGTDLKKLIPGGSLLYPDVVDAQIQGDKIWMVTNSKGLRSVHTPSMKLTEYHNDPYKKNSINSNNLNCLLIEQNGDIWIGTKGAGLDHFDRQKNIFRHYNIDDGLCNNSIFSMVKDEHGRLWLGTGNGLSCFDISTKIFTNFSRSDGLVNSEFNRYSACKLSDGYILMGGMNGIDYFHPDSLANNDVKPQVLITDFRVFNKPVFPFTDLSLAHDQNYVTIDFAAMDFRNTSLNKFAYKLEGIDKDWIIAGNLHSVSYATLAPGSYHFLVKATGSDGAWNEMPAEITFTISSPWWQTWWFYMLCTIFVIALLYLFYRYRIAQVRKIYKMRNEISQDLHDQVGATLTSISYLSEVAKQQKGSNSGTSGALEKIGEYSREMIGEMNDIVWAINPANDRFDRITDRMQNYASPLLATKNIQLNFDADQQLKQVTLSTQQRKNLYLIFKEAINNAAKHAACSYISVKLYHENNNICLHITDNGKGFTEKQSENGNGQSNMKLRAAAINATINIIAGLGTGTSIQLSLPITHNAYIF
jgi:ligand-binding sensor domain-containing protein